jgi:hypothetical protein
MAKLGAGSVTPEKTEENFIASIKNQVETSLVEDINGSLEFILPKEHLADGHPKLKGLLCLLDAFCTLRGLDYSFDSNIRTSTETYASVETALRVSGRDESNKYYREVSGCGECSPDNMEAPYNKYPVANAQTRSMARAIRFFFGITRCAAEEIGPEATDTAEDTSSFINNMIRKAADKKGADLEEVCRLSFNKKFAELDQQERQKLLGLLKG